MICSDTSWVLAFPPRSEVRIGVSARTRAMACTTASPASAYLRCSSIMAPDQIWPIGFATPLPAMSGAEPCTGSNMDGNSPSGLRLAEGFLIGVPRKVPDKNRVGGFDPVGFAPATPPPPPLPGELESVAHDAL